MWWKKNRRIVLVPLLIAAVLAAAFWYGGDAPGTRGWAEDDNEAALSPAASAAVDTVPGPDASGEEKEGDGAVSGADSSAAVPNEDEADSHTDPAGGEARQETGADPAAGTDPYGTEPVPAGNPLPVEPQDAEVSASTYTCTLSVRCDTILDNLDWLVPEKVELVPEDGVIFPASTVTFYEGESVFNVLQREMKKAGIHLEFENTPMYNSAYIEGICNLYEFDCGERSGWMYKVNGWFPNYGCSRYQLKDGDVVEWVYSCDQGADVGGSNAAGS